MKAKVGDWVCFMSDGMLVIGSVGYVKSSVLNGEEEYFTSAGAAHEDRILEVRKCK